MGPLRHWQKESGSSRAQMDARTWLLLEQDGPSVIAELSELQSRKSHPPTTLTIDKSRHGRRDRPAQPSENLCTTRQDLYASRACGQHDLDAACGAAADIHYAHSLSMLSKSRKKTYTEHTRAR